MNQQKQVDILFIIPPYHKRNGSGSFFPLGISAIMACLDQRSLTYSFIDCQQFISTLFIEDLDRLEQKLKVLLTCFDPLVVGIGPCVTPGIKGLEVITRCCIEAFGKERVFAGGPFTMLPSQEWVFYEHLGLSYVIKGDGELAVCDAIETLKKGLTLDLCEAVSHQGYSKVNIISNLDDMPFPKRDGLGKVVLSERRQSPEAGTKSAHIVASRGCPYHCDYCVSGNLGIRFRKRSPENIVREMKMLSEQYNVSDIVFYDDCFFTGGNGIHDEIKAFCCELEKACLKMTWQIEIRPDIFIKLCDDELSRLSQLGCRQMNIGIEKTNFNGAALFGKSYDFEKLKECIVHSHAITPIRMTGTFILGGKGETRETVYQLINASVHMNLDAAEYSPLFVYPDTPLYKEVFQDPKSWLDVVLSSNEPWGEVVYENEDLKKEELIFLVKEAYRCFYPDLKDTDRVQDRSNLEREQV